LAFVAIYFLERACSAQVRAQGGELNMPSEEALATTREQSSTLFTSGVDMLAWPALLRKLDRLDPSFRD
jgi:hypothetical protein